MGEAIVFTSGKGGVGKTTAIANIGTELSLLDKKVVMLDTDMGLRNLDVVIGLEDCITYNLMDVLTKKCRLQQALIRDKRYPNLYIIPASLSCEGLLQGKDAFAALITELKREFDYCLIDCPAGIDSGFQFAVSAADRAIVVTTPHVSAVHDASRVIYLLQENRFLQIDLLINEVDSGMIRKHNMLSIADVEEILGIKSIGAVPVDNKIIVSQNRGEPINAYRCSAAKSFRLLARRIEAARVIPADMAEDGTQKKKKSVSAHGKEYRYEIS